MLTYFRAVMIGPGFVQSLRPGEDSAPFSHITWAKAAIWQNLPWFQYQDSKTHEDSPYIYIFIYSTACMWYFSEQGLDTKVLRGNMHPVYFQTFFFSWLMKVLDWSVFLLPAHSVAEVPTAHAKIASTVNIRSCLGLNCFLFRHFTRPPIPMKSSVSVINKNSLEKMQFKWKANKIVLLLLSTKSLEQMQLIGTVWCNWRGMFPGTLWP